MTLRPIDATGSQRFFAPDNYNTAGDVTLARGGTGVAQPSVRPLGAPRIFGPKAVKGANGLYWVKLEWDDQRGGFMQYGSMEEAMHTNSLSTLVGDDKGILRHFFLTSNQATPDPNGAAIPTRLVHANVFNRLLIAMSEISSGGSADSLYQETSATDPTIIKVVGWARPSVNCVGINQIRKVNINGVTYAALCWYLSGGGFDSLQLLSDLANPPTLVNVAVGNGSVFDIIQVPVYGDALLMLYSNTVKRASAAATAPGALAFSTIETVPGGGQWIGIMGAGVGVGTPSVAGLFPNEGATVFSPRNPGSGIGETNKGKILIFQTSGQLLGELPVKTPYVTNATKFADGMVYCDQTTHYYWDGRNHIPMLKSQDRYPDSNFKRVCCGHYVKGDKFFWSENYTIATGGTGNTQQYWMEYDVYTNTSKNISSPQDLTTTGQLTLGGCSCPVSTQTDFLHTYATGIGKWYRQYQSPSAFRGFDQRKTAGSAAGTGQQYEPTGTWVSTAVEITGYENAAKVVSRWTGPLNSSLAQGGTGGTPAYLEVGVTGQVAFNATQEAKERRLMKDFPLGMNSVFRGPVQLTVVSHQQSGGTDDTRFTTNVLPQSIELYMYEPGSRYSEQYEQWDRQGWPNA